jgi:flagellar basal-body rod protein FlgC
VTQVNTIAPMFSALGVPASGMRTYRTWMDAIADNVANANTVRPTNENAFQERFVIAQAREYGSGIGNGVEVAGVTFGDPNGVLVYQPNHPLADEEGNVRFPDMQLSDQMVNLIAAQRAYQMNVSVFERARDSYQRALEIGKT